MAKKKTPKRTLAHHPQIERAQSKLQLPFGRGFKTQAGGGELEMAEDAPKRKKKRGK